MIFYSDRNYFNDTFISKIREILFNLSIMREINEYSGEYTQCSLGSNTDNYYQLYNKLITYYVINNFPWEIE